MEIHAHSLRPEGLPLNTVEGTVWRDNLVIDTKKNYLLKGTSGRGKSTFLHILCGIRKNYTGRFTVDGKDGRDFTPQDWATLRGGPFGIVFQDLRLLPQLTARQNLDLKSALQDVPTDPVDMESKAQGLGVHPYLDNSCGKLSYGQQQRFAILRALLQPFQFLLLDEPFSHLDPENTKMAVGMVQNICKERGAGMLVSTLSEDYRLDWDEVLEV